MILVKREPSNSTRRKREVVDACQAVSRCQLDRHHVRIMQATANDSILELRVRVTERIEGVVRTLGYSITRSARAIKVGGRTRPRAPAHGA